MIFSLILLHFYSSSISIHVTIKQKPQKQGNVFGNKKGANQRISLANPFLALVPPAGIEPATPGLGILQIQQHNIFIYLVILIFRKQFAPFLLHFLFFTYLPIRPPGSYTNSAQVILLALKPITSPHSAS